MKKQITKRLTLSKETLRNLSERELQGVVGGATRTEIGLQCSNPCISDGGSCPSTYPC